MQGGFKMKKRVILPIGLIILSLWLMAGCTPKLEDNNQSKELTIVTSFYPIYLHVINITQGIPGIKVVNMTQPQTGCLHDYQLTPNDLKILDQADIFVINGGGMENFIDKAVAQIPTLEIVDASSEIEFIHDHHINPHVWVSVSGAISQVSEIAKQLSGLDQAHEEAYHKNAKVYIEKLELLSQEMHDVLDHVPHKNIVTFHEAFPYFAKEFGLNIVGTIVDEPGSEPSAKDLEAIIENIKKHQVKAVFAEPQYESKSADVIAKEAKVKLYTLDPVVTGQANESQKDQYLIVMRENLETLKEALQ